MLPVNVPRPACCVLPLPSPAIIPYPLLLLSLTLSWYYYGLQNAEFVVPDEMSKVRICEIVNGGHFFVHEEGNSLALIEAKLKELKEKVCIFIKLRITAQSGPVILVILCHSH